MGQASEVEFAVTIADAWQDVGLGRLLLSELIALASARGVAALVGEALSESPSLLGSLASRRAPTRRTRAQRYCVCSSNAPTARSGTQVITGDALNLLA